MVYTTTENNHDQDHQDPDADRRRRVAGTARAGQALSAPRPSSRPRLRLRDPKLWVGLLITGVTVWLAVRGVSFADLARDLRRADLLVLAAYSVPAYLAGLYLRALRWRHLTDAVQPIDTGPLFRATAVGFMVNNLVPLRVGEVVRAWMLAREVGASGAAILGTVLLERVIDAAVVCSLALLVLGSQAGLADSAAHHGARTQPPGPVSGKRHESYCSADAARVEG